MSKWTVSEGIGEGVMTALAAIAPKMFVKDVPEVPTIPPKPADQIVVMPKIDITEYDSPNCSTRTEKISKLVVHNTDNNSLDGSVSWLCNPEAQASAHLVIGRDGKVACIVDFNKAAWHAGNRAVNHASIGIECVADENHRGLTPAQEKVLVSWIKWAMFKYGFKKEDVITHRTVVNTSCPCWLWPEEKDFIQWKNEHF